MTNIEKIASLTTLKKNIQSQYFANANYNFENKTMYFGTGLASVDTASLGFGIEIMGTIMSSLWLKRELGLKKVIHEISTVGYNIDDITREQLISQEQEIINKLIKNLQLSDSYDLFFSHDYHKNKDFNDYNDYVKKSLKKFETIAKFDTIGNYTSLQIAGMKYLYDKYDTRLKLGWITDKKKPLEHVCEDDARQLIEIGHLNEYYFDNMYRYVFPNDEYSFLYTPCAIDFVNGNRCVPYTVVEGQNRPVLNNDYNLLNFYNSIPDSKIKNKNIQNWGSYIVDVFEDLFYSIPINNDDKRIETVEKVEYIKKKVLSN